MYCKAMLGLLPAALLLVSCGKTEKPAGDVEAPTHVLVETVSNGAIDHVVTADAVLYPVNQSNVTPKISAPVKRMLVNRGDHVRAGQLLAELESADLAASVEEAKQNYEQTQAAYQGITAGTAPEDKTKAEADVRAAQGTLDAAKKLYDSRVALEKEGALAMRQVDESRVAMVQAQSTFETAQRHLQSLNQVNQREAARGSAAQMNAAKARYDNAVVQLGYARVVSPISGVVADRMVYPGEMAASGAPLVSIVDISTVVARANIPVSEAASLTVGRPARITGPGGDVAGTVKVVSPSASPNSTTVEIWVDTPNPGEKLKPGGTVRLNIIAETIRNTVIIPATALLNSDTGSPKVMIIDDKMMARERMISLGVRQGDRVQILSGVAEGDKVVVSGGLGLEDKAKVIIDQPKNEDEDEDNADDSKDEAPAGKDQGKDAKGKAK
jgi:HlyD family secretion protein